MSIYHQFVHQRHAQIKDTFDSKMSKIDKLKESAPKAEDDPNAEAAARAHRHKLRVEAATEYCDARKILNNMHSPSFGPKPWEKK